MNPKPVWKSKTFVINMVALVVMVVGSGELAAVLPEHAMSYVVMVQSVANIILRLVTNQPVSIKGGQA